MRQSQNSTVPRNGTMRKGMMTSLNRIMTQIGTKRK